MPDVRSIQETLNIIRNEVKEAASTTSMTLDEMRDDMEHTNAKLQKELQESVRNGNEAKVAAREATEVGRTVTAIVREIKSNGTQSRTASMPSYAAMASRGLATSIHNTQSFITTPKQIQREIIVNIRDPFTIANLRAMNPRSLKAHIDRAIEQSNNEHIVNIKVVSSNQLKSGDISIKTATTKEMETLRQFTEDWAHRIGNSASVRLPTYGVLAHGIRTSSINIEKSEDIRSEILLDNKPFIPNAEIKYIGWLSRISLTKPVSSIIIEFTKPEDANKIIDEGLIWQGQVFQCELYDRGSRLKQCFHCQRYGHIGTQCKATKACGYCAEDHSSRDCPTRTDSSAPRKCATCQGAHTSWSSQCPTRKDEMAKVRAAYDTRPIYHPVIEKIPQDPTPGERRTIAKNPGQAQEPRIARSRSPARRGQKRVNTGDTLAPGNKENEPSTGANAQRLTRIRTLSRRALEELDNNSQLRLHSSQHMDLTTNTDS
ncbi:hypothetical protein NPX13_g9270 [Xylaria arbuscula]|uniref:CCHC-type domain-containing protein n=1 Tax=Xylaria arbuscula TaxID=114810 RepID=A0A9W8N756_9PEZI|nr:hypothetical protein NPX13_g9270 [Xylaria arbuscula]